MASSVLGMATSSPPHSRSGAQPAGPELPGEIRQVPQLQARRIEGLTREIYEETGAARQHSQELAEAYLISSLISEFPQMERISATSRNC